jgi:hypothetical protein
MHSGECGEPPSRMELQTLLQTLTSLTCVSTPKQNDGPNICLWSPPAGFGSDSQAGSEVKGQSASGGQYGASLSMDSAASTSNDFAVIDTEARTGATDGSAAAQLKGDSQGEGEGRVLVRVWSVLEGQGRREPGSATRAALGVPVCVMEGICAPACLEIRACTLPQHNNLFRLSAAAGGGTVETSSGNIAATSPTSTSSSSYWAAAGLNRVSAECTAGAAGSSSQSNCAAQP